MVYQNMERWIQRHLQRRFILCSFGMMSADIGYGLVLWLATFLALKLFVLDKGMKRNLMFFHLLSYPTVVWGIIFGSFFGVDMPFQPLSLSKDLTTIMILSIIFGVIQNYCRSIYRGL